MLCFAEPGCHVVEVNDLPPLVDIFCLAPQRQDSIHVKSGLGGPYYDWSAPYQFDYDTWYKLAIKVNPDGHVGFYVNDQLVRTENWKPGDMNFSNPSFGARALFFSVAHYDDFTMAEYTP